MVITDDLLEPATEQGLLARACAGDAQAFWLLTEPLQPRLLRQATALCGDVSTAEGLVSETLVEAWQGLPRYRNLCRFSTWLYSILKWFRNRCGRHHESLCLLACGALPETQTRELEGHLAACAACRQYYLELKAVAAPLAGWEKIFANVEPDPAARRRWARALEAVAAPPSDRRSAPMKVLDRLWLELIWPARRIWAGLAAVWLALVLFNFSQAGGRDALTAKSTVPAAEVRRALQERQVLLTELLGQPPAAAPAEPPRRSPPHQPRSERRVTLRCA